MLCKARVARRECYLGHPSFGCLDFETVFVGVDEFVAIIAKSDQVLFGIAARATAEFLVVNFQIRHRPARLTAPSIAAEYLLTKFIVGRRIKPQPLAAGWPRVHADFSVTVSRNVCF